ncbi:MAG TPA: response regulator, partial [Spirochaetia bacterium]|nr:response regulator [Spirochaetia bacterium]
INLDAVTRDLSAEQNGFSGETTIIQKGGVTVPVFLTVYPIQNEQGRITGLLEVAFDISERRLAEAERAVIEEQYHQTQKVESIGRLAGGIAHDLNNLLTPILGYGGLLREALGADHPQHESVEGIISAGTIARDLVGKLLAFSRKQALRYESVDLNSIVLEFHKLLRHTIPEHINLELQTAARPLPVIADIHQIEQVIMNLAINAAEAMPAGGRLCIATEFRELNASDPPPLRGLEPGFYALLTVRDSGFGMDPETLTHIFEPFFTTKGTKSTGLGLATVYGIVKQHRGLIDVESEPGKGSVFTVYLPLTAGKPGRVHAPPHTDHHLTNAGTVLVVEDNELVRNLVQRILEKHGFTVLCAEHAEAALNLIACRAPSIDLLISDIILTGMNGRELCRVLRQQHPSLRVLFMSGYTKDIPIDKSVIGETTAFIRKPFTPREFTDAVSRLLSKTK